MSLLDIYLYGRLVAHVDRERRRVRPRLTLHYTTGIVAQVPQGQPLLSVSLPVRDTPYVGVHGALPFVEGLLPEGAAGEQIAARFDLERGDVVGLLAAVGWECAGAVTVVAAGHPATHPEARWEPISDDEVAERLRRAPREPLGVGDVVRLSLGGAQPKLLLAHTSDGRWASPQWGAPSTHLLKPAQETLWPNLVANEAVAMRTVAHLGIPTAEVSIARFDDVDALVVTRFDRVHDAHGGLRRVHQEDFVSALGIRPANKYENNPKTGVTFQRMAAILHRYAPPEDVRTLARLMVANTAIGNADAHGRNYGLLLYPDGPVRLAPAYDVVCTAVYPDLTPVASIPVAGVTRIDRITPAHLVTEITSWGIAEHEAHALVNDTLAAMPQAAQRARDDVADPAGDDAFSAIRRRLDGQFRPPTGRQRHVPLGGP